MQQDPLNPLPRHAYAVCLTAAGKLSEAESEYRQVLEIDPRFRASRANLVRALACRGALGEALELTEAVYGIAPTAHTAAMRAALLKLTGQPERAEDALRKLREMPGFKLHHLWGYRLLTGETDKAADCMRMLVDERDFVVATAFRLAQGLRPSPHWAEVARMMNLPE